MNETKRLAMCAGKETFHDRAGAARAARRLSRHRPKGRVPVSPYRCPVCRLWHNATQRRMAT